MKRRPTVATVLLVSVLIVLLLFTSVGGTGAAPITGQSTGGVLALSQSSSASPVPGADYDSPAVASANSDTQLPDKPLDHPNTAEAYFVTNPWDADSDGDGLTDGDERLYRSDPNDPNSPGIYIQYTSDLKTGKYFSWERNGTGLIAHTSAVVRRGATFLVGGPPDATLQVQKSWSGLTTLSTQRDPSTGRWKISVPSTGTVGRYQLALSKPGWSQTMNLYVIFDLPASLGSADLAAYAYDDDPNGIRDEYAIWFMTSDDLDPGNWCPGDPTCHIAGGRGWAFELDQYQSWVFENYIIDQINGYTSRSAATNALGHYVDSILRIEPYSLRTNMYDALHSNQQAQCSTHASVLTSLLRGAGLPARPVVADWDENIVYGILFDHSTEVYYGDTWLVMRAYLPPMEPITSSISGGIISARSRSSWFYDSPSADLTFLADSNWNPDNMETDYNHTQNQYDYFIGSWDDSRIVKWDWVKTQMNPYWGTSWAEPQSIGYPYQSWLSWPSRPEAGAAPIRPNQASPASTADGPVKLGQIRGERGVDLDGNQRFDQLVISVEVTATVPGNYNISALLDSAGNTEVPKGHGIAGASSYVFLQAGTQIVPLAFVGQDIFQSRSDGPYRVKGMWVSDLGPDDHPEDPAGHILDQRVTSYSTAAYRYTDFETLGANLLDQYQEQATSLGTAGLPASLGIAVDFAISTPGTYSVTATLADAQGLEIGSAAWAGTASPALLEFQDIRGTTGPYTLKSLRLLNSRDEIVDSRSTAYTTRIVTQGQPRSRLRAQAPSSKIGTSTTYTSTFTDAGVDTNGNGLYDLLRFTVDLQIASADAGQAYHLEGGLVDPNGHAVSWAVSTPRVLAQGIQYLSLDFNGQLIHGRGLNGSFSLVWLKVIRSSTGEVVDQLDVAHTTPSYNHASFEEPLVSPATVAFEDSLEGGTGNWTGSSVWNIATLPWSPMHSALKGDASGNASGTLTSVPIDIRQFAQPTLFFQTSYSMGSGDAGYLELSTDNITWTRVATYTGSTTGVTNAFVDLTRWEHAAALQMRFKVASQSRVVWYLDNFYVFGLPGITTASITSTPAAGPWETTFAFEAQYTGSAAVGPVTYEWDFGDGTTLASSSSTAAYRYGAPGSYTVRLTLRSQYDAHVVTRQLVVYQALTGITYTLTPIAPSPGDVITFQANLQPHDANLPVSYTWDFGDGSSPVTTTSSSVTHSYPEIALIRVTLTASNEYGPPVSYDNDVLVGIKAYLPLAVR